MLSVMARRWLLPAVEISGYVQPRWLPFSYYVFDHSCQEHALISACWQIAASRSPSPARDNVDNGAKQPSPSSYARNVWHKLVTPEGRFYYHDTVNNRTQWTPPLELRSVRFIASFMQAS
jgi:hypothetical protein